MITENSPFLLINHRGMSSAVGPALLGVRGHGCPPDVTVMSPDRMSSYTAACIPNNFIYVSCLGVFKRRALQSTRQRMTVGRIRTYRVVL